MGKHIMRDIIGCLHYNDKSGTVNREKTSEISPCRTSSREATTERNSDPYSLPDALPDATESDIETYTND